MAPKASRRQVSNYEQGMIIVLFYFFGCVTAATKHAYHRWGRRIPQTLAQSSTSGLNWGAGSTYNIQILQIPGWKFFRRDSGRSTTDLGALLSQFRQPGERCEEAKERGFDCGGDGLRVPRFVGGFQAGGRAIGRGELRRRGACRR